MNVLPVIGNEIAIGVHGRYVNSPTVNAAPACGTGMLH